MKTTKTLFSLALLFASVMVQAGSMPKPEVQPSDNINRVLFVGNSFSYYNNGIQNHVANLVRASGLWQKGHTRYRLKAISGGRLTEHLAGVEPLLQVEEKKAWERVVLQGYSNAPVSDKHHQAFKDGALALSKLVRQYKAEPIMFMTWAYKGDKDMVSGLAKAYIDEANRLGALVVPVGLAFENSLSAYPDIELYIPDVGGFTEQGKVEYKETLKHPSLAGTYLAACTFFAALYNRSPEGLPYLADLSPEVATRMQTIAWKTYTEFYSIK